MDKEWSIRSYNEGDEHSITALFNDIFNKSRTLAHWDWEFKKNPEGFKVLVAEQDDNVIAHLAALPRTIKIGQENALASLEVDGMTHPNFTRRGIFIALGKRLLSESVNEDIAIVIGFPNENALPGHRKLNAVELFRLPVMIRPINFRNLSKKLFANRVLRKGSELFGRFLFRVVYRAKKAHIEDDVTITAISTFDSSFDRFWEEASSSHTVILQRDSRYLNWRYILGPGQAEHPEHPYGHPRRSKHAKHTDTPVERDEQSARPEHAEQQYQVFAAKREEEVLAFVVLRVIELFGLRNGAIVDMMALPNHENAAHALLLRAVEHLAEKKVDLIACLIPKWSGYNTILRRCGFTACPKRLNPKEEPFIIYPISKDINMEIVTNPSNWFITWGDTDVV